MQAQKLSSGSEHADKLSRFRKEICLLKQVLHNCLRTIQTSCTWYEQSQPAFLSTQSLHKVTHLRQEGPETQVHNLTLSWLLGHCTAAEATTSKHGSDQLYNILWEVNGRGWLIWDLNYILTAQMSAPVNRPLGKDS